MEMNGRRGKRERMAVSPHLSLLPYPSHLLYRSPHPYCTLILALIGAHKRFLQDGLSEVSMFVLGKVLYLCMSSLSPSSLFSSLIPSFYARGQIELSLSLLFLSLSHPLPPLPSPPCSPHLPIFDPLGPRSLTIQSFGTHFRPPSYTPHLQYPHCISDR